MTLSDHDIDRIAERVVELLDDRPARRDAPEMLDATEAARRLGVSREWVYEHADELGAKRIGSGDKPRLRFDPATVAAFGAPSEAPTPIGTRRRRRRTASGSQLLPIRGAA